MKGGDLTMTVGTQMQQVIAGVQSAAATMKTFALQTEDKQAKQEFHYSYHKRAFWCRWGK
jgi:hypothetical protein